jgi:hypothetical protein
MSGLLVPSEVVCVVTSPPIVVSGALGLQPKTVEPGWESKGRDRTSQGMAPCRHAPIEVELATRAIRGGISNTCHVRRNKRK